MNVARTRINVVFFPPPAAGGFYIGQTGSSLNIYFGGTLLVLRCFALLCYLQEYNSKVKQGLVYVYQQV
jgi:hypothetical protein